MHDPDITTEVTPPPVYTATVTLEAQPDESFESVQFVTVAVVSTNLGRSLDAAVDAANAAVTVLNA